MKRDLAILGFGYVGRALASRARGERDRVWAITLSGENTEAAAQGSAAEIHVARVTRLEPQDIVSRVTPQTDVVVTFPPDGHTDARIAPSLVGAGSVVYVSTTGVYGDARGTVNEETPVDLRLERARRRFEAEQCYRRVGATVLRCAGIYGPGRGIHERIAQGTFRMPGDGQNVVSRIHVVDLVSIILAALESFPRSAEGRVFVVADDTPVPQREAVAWLCEQLDCAWPPSVGPEEAPETLRHDRRVDNRRVKAALGLALAYPGYREGFGAEIAASARSRSSGARSRN